MLLKVLYINYTSLLVCFLCFLYTLIRKKIDQIKTYNNFKEVLMTISNVNEWVGTINSANELTLEEIYFINSVFGIDFFVGVNDELFCERGIDVNYH